MPQEFHVLRCFKCTTFQVQIVKKSSNKWLCKICNEKQSLKKVYTEGTGKECRLHVQKLNLLSGEKNELISSSSTHITANANNHQIPDNLEETKGQPVSHQSVAESSGSKWDRFINKPATASEESEEDEDNTIHLQPLNLQYKKHFSKRKKNIRTDSEDYKGQNFKKPKVETEDNNLLNQFENVLDVKIPNKETSDICYWGENLKKAKDEERQKQSSSKWNQDSVPVNTNETQCKAKSKLNKFVVTNDVPVIESSQNIVEKQKLGFIPNPNSKWSKFLPVKNSNERDEDTSSGEEDECFALQVPEPDQHNPEELFSSSLSATNPADKLRILNKNEYSLSGNLIQKDNLSRILKLDNNSIDISDSELDQLLEL